MKLLSKKILSEFDRYYNHQIKHLKKLRELQKNKIS